MILTEIVCSHPEDIGAAAAGGANRLELCAALETGGLSPSVGLMREAVRSGVPWVAMARPRPGGFLYSEREFSVLLEDARVALAEGAGGIVVGLLRQDLTLDLERTAQVVALGGPVVFHRAFDASPTAWATDLESLVDLGVTRLLTSGRAERAVDGLDVLRGMVTRSEGRIEILPAGGVRAENAARIVAETGVGQVHAAPVGSLDDGTGGLYGGHSGIDRTAVAALVKAVDGL